MIEAFCYVHQDDVPISSDRFCTIHKTLTIPPSWSDRFAAYPYPARPYNYRYAPRAFPETKATAKAVTTVREPISHICGHCGAAFAPTARNKGSQRYCSDACKGRAHTARLASRRFAAREPLSERPCDRCGTTYRPVAPKRGGHPSQFCGAACQRSHAHEADPRLFANRGAA